MECSEKFCLKKIPQKTKRERERERERVLNHKKEGKKGRKTMT